MSAKSKLYVPAAPTETLVTVEKLAAINNAMGFNMVYPCSPPGLKFPATNTIRIQVHTSRTPYIYFRFHVETWSSNPSTSRWDIQEHEGSGKSYAAAEGFFQDGESRDYVLIHRCMVSQGRTANPVVFSPTPSPGTPHFWDPITLLIRFRMEQNNGDPSALAANYVKNIVVGGCPDADVPFLVTNGGANVERVIRTNF
jgi:hypothetical protein